MDLGKPPAGAGPDRPDNPDTPFFQLEKKFAQSLKYIKTITLVH